MQHRLFRSLACVAATLFVSTGDSRDAVATTYANLDASRVTHAPDTICVNLADLPGLLGQQIVLAASPVPEAPVGALMLCGVAAFVWLDRRAKGRRVAGER